MTMQSNASATARRWTCIRAACAAGWVLLVSHHAFAQDAGANAAALAQAQLRAQQQLTTLAQAPAADVQRGTKTAALRTQLDALKAAATALRADLAGRPPTGMPASVQSRHGELQSEFNRRQAEFERAINAWQASPSDAGATELRVLFERYPAAVARPAAQNNALPWGAQPTRRLPAETRSAWYQQLMREQRVVLAQAAGLSVQGGVQFSVLPAPEQAPQDADLAQTAEVQLAPAVRAKAVELGHNPVAIANWLTNAIVFTPGWGATQTAAGVLQSGRGNAIDIATLTVALLRASGVPARYQFGTIDVPAGAAQSWLGVGSAQAAVDLLQRSGVAARGIADAGQIQSVRMEHAWAVAYVNWSPGRGSRAGGAAVQPNVLGPNGQPQHPHPNAQLNAWVPLDASYKQQATTAGKLAGIAPFTAQGVLDAARQGATCTAASAAGLNQQALQAHYSQYKTQAAQQIAALGSDTRVGQVLGTVSTVQRNSGLLAGTLAQPTVVAQQPAAALPAAMRWAWKLALAGGTDTVFAFDKPLANLQGQPLVLGFVPETDADAQALAGLLTGGGDASGLPASIPAYLVKLQAQLTLGGQVVAQGGSFTLGQPLALRTQLLDPQAQGGAGDTTIVAGETQAWSVQPGAHGAAGVQALGQRLQQLRTQLDGANLPTGAQQAATLLWGVASAYQAALDAQAGLAQRAAGVLEVRQPGMTRAATRLVADQAYGLVLSVRPAGVALSADRLAGAAAAAGADVDAVQWQRQSLQRAAAGAHRLLDQVFGPAGTTAQSALSAVAAAALSGQTLWRADRTTVTQVLAALDAESSLRDRVQQAASNGWEALVPASSVALDAALPVDAVIVNDPASGAGDYVIATRRNPLEPVTGQRFGLAGWLGLAGAAPSKVLTAPALQAAVERINTVQVLLGNTDTQRWQDFAGAGEALDALYQSRLGQAAGTANACDWLTATLASQLGSGLPAASRANQPPVITSSAVTLAAADTPYGYQAQAVDADGDTIAFSLTSAPGGMAISPAGLLQWQRPLAGQYTVAIQATDGLAFAEQRFTLSVGAAGNLTVGLALTPSIASPGQTVTLSVTVASSQSGSITRTATIDGAPLPLNAQGTAVFAAPATGAHPIVVKAADGRTTATREAVLLVRDASDSTAPTAAITSPEGDAGLRGIVTVTGTASDAHLGYWQLLLRPAGASDSSWQEVARGLSAVTNAPLAQVDTSRHANGVYQLLLRAVDVNGAETTANVAVEFLGNQKLGQFRLSFADVRAEAPGLPLMLTRTYDSTKKDVLGDFGWGWSASGQDITVRKNMTFGAGWQVVQQQFQLCLKPVGRRRISVTLPDGGLYRFDAANSPECQFGAVPEANPVFTAVPGPTGGPAGRSGAGGQLRVINDTLVMAQGGMLVDADSGAPWNPSDFELTTEEGVKYLLREGVGVLSVTDVYGNKVTYGANGYSHSANLAVALTRDAQGRITKASDPNGKSLAYAYNSAGELASVTDRDGKTTQFGYAAVAGTNGAATSGNQDQRHLLASITDPRGQVVMSNQFDEYGRLTAAADALGQAARQEFDAANFKQTVTDRRGNKTVYTFDAEGNITELLNALNQQTTFTFDANGNETSVTNALGEKTERSFDAATGKQLSEKNALGHVTRTVYPGVGLAWQRMNPTATVDARGNTTTIGYLDEKQPGAIPLGIQEPLGRSTAIAQGAGGLILSLNVAGEATGYAYDAQGRKTRETNGLGQSTTYTYDALGNELGRTVAKSVNGATVTYTVSRTYDAENRLTSETDALGGKRTSTYNAAGKVATQTDALGRVTSYSYDANARLTKTSYPDGISESTGYDAEGNEVAKTDRAGRLTRMEYDALNRPVRTTYPDGTSESTEYDAAGRTVASTDRRGKRAAMEYDAAGRQTASTDASGRRTAQAYDENGNRTSVTVDGRTTSYTYDALNRLTKTTWPDGSTHTVVYRADNRKQSETDARGVTTTYGYDAAGRLTSVTQSGVSGSTSYGYDETGGKVRQVDALGRTTTWTMDANGRITSRTIGDGSKEASQYDAEGNRLGKTTFAGERLSFQYDPDNRLAGQAVPAGTGGNSAVPQALVSYGYTASGQIQSQQEQGATTLNAAQTYKYDANDRLVEVKNPIGQIGYTLDANGNVTERSVSGAGTTRNEYDEPGRLAKVTAPDGKQARYTYDQAGRLTTTERDLNPLSSQAQVLFSYSRYDSADRTTAIAHVTKAGGAETLVAGQALTRGTGGAISRIDTYRTGAGYDSATGQFSGTPATTQNFEYDGNARLTREQRTSAGNTADTRYEYDAAGNRTKKTATTAAGAEVTTYGYDNADRLISESTSLPAGGTRAISYTWDGNGNLASKTEAGKVTLYRFDPQNRLIDIRAGATQAEASAATPGVSYAYDAAGNRIRKTTPQGTTGYLIDGSHAYPQVALESKGGEATSYLHGVQIVRQTKGAEELFPLPGHLNTSLGAVDASGAVAEQTNADAFGNLDQPTSLKQTHLYTGEYWDQDAQLLYLRARWYDPRIGRFISADPFEGKQRNPRSLNRYTYAHGDPVHNKDPRGKFSMGELSVGSAISVAMAGYTGYSATTNVMNGDYTGAATDVALGLITLGAASAGPAIFKTIVGSCSAWCTLFFKFSAAERAVLAEVKAAQAAGAFAKAKSAVAAGKEAEIVIGNRAVQVVPEFNGSGMTLFVDDTFIIGREAIASEAEFFKTLLHELYRLAFQRGVQAGAVGGATAPTANAFSFAEKAIALFVK